MSWTFVPRHFLLVIADVKNSADGLADIFG
jgi:hypothetical protein